MNDRVPRRASRLARLYPRQWRQEFPDFEAFLAGELVEHPRGVRRDIVRAAMVERLRESGVIPKRPIDGVRSGLALIYAGLIPFTGLAMGMWSQLHTGLASNTAAKAPVLQASNLLLTVGTLAVLVLLPLAIVLVVVDGRRNRSDAGTLGMTRCRPLVRLCLVLLGSLGILAVTGWGADRSHWYSPAAAALPHEGAGHVATLWVRGIVATITPAWIHPTLFARMPSGELVAALVAPLAVLAAAGAMFRLIVRFPLRWPSRANVVLAVGAFGMMFVSVVACGRWLLDHPGREGATALQARADRLAPGHTAWTVVILLTALAIAALVGLRRVLKGHPEGPTRSGGGEYLPTVSESPVTGATIPLFFGTQ